jgi:uncharacterized peroxidase-related enzyme
MTGPLMDFTIDVPKWKPRVTPIVYDNATEEQREALQSTPSDRGVSDYVLVLAHDPKTLKERTPLFNGIMYSRGGLSRAETELSAVAASVYNRCIYCTAVHASRYNQLTKNESVMEAIFKDGENAPVDPRQSAILRFATKLSRTPSDATEADVTSLVEQGLQMDEILDSILSASIFGWANRLMHTLGEPHKAEA